MRALRPPGPYNPQPSPAKSLAFEIVHIESISVAEDHARYVFSEPCVQKVNKTIEYMCAKSFFQLSNAQSLLPILEDNPHASDPRSVAALSVRMDNLRLLCFVWWSVHAPRRRTSSSNPLWRVRFDTSPYLVAMAANLPPRISWMPHFDAKRSMVGFACAHAIATGAGFVTWGRSSAVVPHMADPSVLVERDTYDNLPQFLVLAAKALCLPLAGALGKSLERTVSHVLCVEVLDGAHAFRGSLLTTILSYVMVGAKHYITGPARRALKRCVLSCPSKRFSAVIHWIRMYDSVPSEVIMQMPPDIVQDAYAIVVDAPHGMDDVATFLRGFYVPFGKGTPYNPPLHKRTVNKQSVQWPPTKILSTEVGVLQAVLSCFDAIAFSGGAFAMRSVDFDALPSPPPDAPSQALDPLRCIPVVS